MDEGLDCTALLMAVIYRAGTGDDWFMHAVGVGAMGRTVRDNVAGWQAFLRCAPLANIHYENVDAPMQIKTLTVPDAPFMSFTTPSGGTQFVTVPEYARPGDVLVLCVVYIYYYKYEPRSKGQAEHVAAAEVDADPIAADQTDADRVDADEEEVDPIASGGHVEQRKLPNSAYKALLKKGQGFKIAHCTNTIGGARFSVIMCMNCLFALPLSYLSGNFTLGLAWDVTDGLSIDLDASCVYLDKKLQPIDTVYFCKLRSDDGALVHSGDEVAGDAAGDDESIRVRSAPIVYSLPSFI